MYMLQIVRFLAMLQSDLRHEAFTSGITNVSGLVEYFKRFFASDGSFKSRKTWSIYSI